MSGLLLCYTWHHDAAKTEGVGKGGKGVRFSTNLISRRHWLYMRKSLTALALRRSSGSLFTCPGHTRSMRDGVFQQGHGLAFLRDDTPLNEAVSSRRYSREMKELGQFRLCREQLEHPFSDVLVCNQVSA